MKSQEQSSEPEPQPQNILEQILGRPLTSEEQHMPVYFHIIVEDIESYMDIARQYSFIEIIEPSTRYIGGWEAAVRFPEGQTITFWQERWPKHRTDSAQ